MQQTEAEVGIIEMIKLENFMCHRHLELKLGPNINFIIGQNGSGKSAVLVALTVCLGAKAGFTNRGKKITNFIRGDASSASVSVTLRNRGAEAYKPDLYGKTITIIRTIARSGSSGYKVKSDSGKTIATTRREVLMVMEQFNIQIENPCVILMQDTSRAFLNASKPAEKYKFFLSATQLQQISDDYRTVDVKLNGMKQTLENKQDVLPDLKKRVQELEHQFREVAKLRDLESQVRKMKGHLIWAQLQGREKELAELREKVEARQREIDKNDQVLDKIKNATQKLTEKYEARQKLVDETGAQIRAATAEVETYRTQIGEIKRGMSHHQNTVKDLRKRRDELALRIRKLQEFISDVQEKAMRDTQAEKLERQERIAALQAALQAQHEKAEAMDQELAEHERQRQSIDAELKDLTAKEREVVQEAQKLEGQIRTLELQKADRTRCFGRNMPALLDAINRERRWQKKPIGPLGLCLTIKDDQWATAIETALGRTMDAFVVDNHHDEKILKEIGRRVGQVPDMYVQRFQDRVYHIPDNALPPPHLTTVLSQLQADEVMVYNCLIDQRQIDNIILIPDRQQASQIMFRQRPPNAREGYLPDGSRLLVRGGAEVFNAGNTRARRLGRNFEEQIRDAHVALEHKQKEAAHFRPRVQELRSAADATARALTQLRKQRAALKRDEGRLTADIHELQSVREEAPPDISEAQTSLEGFLKTKEELEAELAKAMEVAGQVPEELGPLQDKFAEKKAEIENLAARSEQIAAKLTSVHKNITTIAAREKQMVLNKEKLMQSKLEEETSLAEQRAALDEEMRRAEQAVPRPEEDLPPPAHLQREIQKMEARIRSQTDGQRSPAEITREFKAAKKAYDEATFKVQLLSSLLELLENDLRDRLNKWLLFRRSIANRTTFHFHGFLSRKGYAGSLSFDHQHRHLDIEVQLDAAQGGPQGARDTRTLSGGERSFSTVALLLSLWEAMESPFRAMDEFDVFMDAVNRHLSLKLLIESARQQRHRQFIFITPHDLTSVASGPDVRVNRMRDPERADIVGIGAQQTILDQYTQS